MDINNLKRNVASIEAGEWVDDIPEMGDGRLRVRGIGSKVYQTVLQRLSRAVPKEQRARDGSLLPDVALRITGEAAAQSLLLEWDRLTDNGRPVPYDSDLAKKWLTDPEFGAFLDRVMWAAQVVEYGRNAAAQALAKN